MKTISLTQLQPDQPLRILWICHDGDLYGSQRSLLAMVKAMAAEGHACFVSVAKPGPLVSLLQEIPSVQVLFHKRVQWVKHDPRSLLQRIGDVMGLLFTSIPRSWLLISTIRQHKINLIHTNVTVSLEGALAAAFLRLPHVWHIRELFMDKSPKFHMVLGCRLSRWLIERLSARVICISEVVKSQFGPYLARQPEKYQRIYNALPLDNLTPLHPRDSAFFQDSRLQAAEWLGVSADWTAPQLGYLGRLSEGKAFHELLEAFALLRLQHPNARLWVAGHFVDQPYEARIRARVEALGLTASVFFLGQLPSPEQFFQLLDVLVVPSVNEPFGRVVIEAMVAGVPCVGANAGGIPEIIESEQTGWIYSQGHISELAQQLCHCFDTPNQLETIRQNARRMVVQRFNIETQIRMLQACYQSVTAQS